MKLKTKLSCDAYLHEMRHSFRNFTELGRNRITGFVVGKFFSITCHVDPKLRNRIPVRDRKNPKRMYNAIGFVKTDDYGTSIYYIYTEGLLNPISVIELYGLALFLTLMKGFLIDEIGITMLIVLTISLILVVISAITSYWVDMTQEGRKVIATYLKDPSDYRSIL